MDSERTSPIKIALLGRIGVGKTYLINRYAYDQVKKHPSTLRYYYREKKLYEGSRDLCWRGDRPMLHQAKVIMLVFAVDSRGSFDDLPPLVTFTKDSASPRAIFVLVATKIDRERLVSSEEASLFAAKNGLMYAETCSMTAEGVSELFETAILEALEPPIVVLDPYVQLDGRVCLEGSRLPCQC